MNTLYNVHVRVSRTWEYRGKSENNPLIHFDMVVIDQMVSVHTPLPAIFIEILFQSIFFPTKLCLHNFKSLKLKLQGYAVYCEVPPQVLDKLKQYLQEGKILYICNACVERAKSGFRVVDTPYILKLIMRTQIFEGNSNDTTFPKYVFSLTPIEMLPQYARRTDRFLGNKKNNCL